MFDLDRLKDCTVINKVLVRIDAILNKMSWAKNQKLSGKYQLYEMSLFFWPIVAMQLWRF